MKRFRKFVRSVYRFNTPLGDYSIFARKGVYHLEFDNGKGKIPLGEFRTQRRAEIVSEQRFKQQFTEIALWAKENGLYIDVEKEADP